MIPSPLLMEVCEELILPSEIQSLYRRFKISYIKYSTLASNSVCFLNRNAYHFFLIHTTPTKYGTSGKMG